MVSQLDEIRFSDAQFFDELDYYWPNDKPIPLVYLESVGGKIYTALKIGRILRKRKGIVATGNPITHIDRYTCLSACALIAAGDVERHLRDVGLHSGAQHLS